MLEIVSKSSLYSIIVTVISFISLMIFFYVKKQDYVKEKDEKGNKVFSYRLALIYSLLFSSAIGLVVVAVSGTTMYMFDKSQKNKDRPVEKSFGIKK